MTLGVVGRDILIAIPTDTESNLAWRSFLCFLSLSDITRQSHPTRTYPAPFQLSASLMILLIIDGAGIPT